MFILNVLWDPKCFDFRSLPQQVTLIKAFDLSNEIKLSQLNNNKRNLRTLKCSLSKLKHRKQKTAAKSYIKDF